MSAKQQLQLQAVEEALGAMVAELNPRVIVASAEKQAALGIAEESMLIPVARRALTVSATPLGGWSIKEFDTGAGEAAPRWEKSFGITDSNVVAVVFGAAIDSLKEQMVLKGKDAMTKEQRTAVEKVLAILEPRHAILLLKGIGSFEFEPIDRAPAAKPAKPAAAPVSAEGAAGESDAAETEPQTYSAPVLS